VETVIRNTEAMASTLEDLPDDILELILAFLPTTRALFRTALVCKRFHQLIQEDGVWMVRSLLLCIELIDFCQSLRLESTKASRNVFSTVCAFTLLLHFSLPHRRVKTFQY